MTVHGDHFVVADVADPASISETLGRHDLWVRELTPLTPDLESVFLQLTGTDSDPGQPRQVDDAGSLPGRAGQRGPDVAPVLPGPRDGADGEPAQTDIGPMAAGDGKAKS